uniref:Transcription-repair-coupling factor n=1 Tax=candidate division WOR-3 bacterium TaxID=2052148 RepID=A0A7C4TBA7_UNCW3
MGNSPLFPWICELIQKLKEKDNISISQLYGSSRSLFILEFAKYYPVIYVTNRNNIERYGWEIAEMNTDVSIIDESNPFFERTRIIIADMDFTGKEIGRKESFEIKRGEVIDREEFLSRLSRTGLLREEIVEEEGEYAVRGGIVDIFLPKFKPLRLEFDGDAISSIRIFNPQTQRSTEVIERYKLNLAVPNTCFVAKDLIKDYGIIITEESLEWPGRQIVIGPGYDFIFHFTPPRKYFGDLKALKDDISRGNYSYKFLVSKTISEKLKNLFDSLEILEIPVREGFVDEDRRIVYLAENEIFGTPPKKKMRYSGLFIDDLKGLKPGDYVVHSDYGIGEFRGLTLLEIEGKKIECLQINYAENSRVYLPIDKVNQIERYIGVDDRPPRLSRLGSDLWLKTKKRIKKAAERIALELINLYAKRKETTGFAFSPDSSEMKELESSFPYEETPDQKRAIEDVKRDMESPFPQERLICGDVGFGKTEVALRSAFKAALDGKQTIFLCPTTLLAFQHYRTFSKRLEKFPVRVEMVSRFKAESELKEILKDFSQGRVDILIGTHRLLQPDVQPRDLGLLIIDEEQRFGVLQKERIKRLKPNIDVLYLSATPIPRTLYMALSGIKDISNIQTPPFGRKEIITKVIYFDDEEIRRIIEFELNRNGQVFFVHNRIQTIETVKERLLNIFPDLRICLLHGKVNERTSEKKMLEFIEGKYDLLLSTAIIESGIDMPGVNTIVVDGADRFGLADLHQLRGRVGRSDVQGYAYFIIPKRKLTKEAERRLGALLTYTSLGSGFRLALRDMEIRGVGNLLGREQSGFVNAIGYHHYVRILNSVINEIKGKEGIQEPIISVNLDAYFPADYIPGPYERTALYKRLLEVESEFELNSIKEEIVDRFGKYPEPVENLFSLARLRLRAIEIGATEVGQKGDKVKFYRDNEVIRVEDLR